MPFANSFIAVLLMLISTALPAHTHHHDEHHQADSSAQPQQRGVDQLVEAAIKAQAGHDFGQALKFTREALSIRGDNDQAWLLLASVHLVRGDADEAAKACRQLRSVSPLVVVTCHARVALAKNDYQTIKPKLEKLIEVATMQRTNNSDLAWALSVAGDLAAKNNESEKAINYYSKSVALSNNAQVRTALADVLIETDQLERASIILGDATASLALEIRKHIVDKRLGKVNNERITALDRRFEVWIEAKDWEHAREMARFYLDVLPLSEIAKQLAKENIQLQREPEDYRLVARTANWRYTGSSLIR